MLEMTKQKKKEGVTAQSNYLLVHRNVENPVYYCYLGMVAIAFEVVNLNNHYSWIVVVKDTYSNLRCYWINMDRSYTVVAVVESEGIVEALVNLAKEQRLLLTTLGILLVLIK
jgi:hypothetical protein